ncbi:glycosyltransferase family 2 protein [Pseudoalteromonas sp. P1-8]|uniref:glycosyltransferase family 2 protein n=1 Tax=Pseudoalteromonas sp. P1-8 TaxID=1710353 RepID=UPI0006DC2566|nr:glycosyltransferase family 2 protein [Pseudoalteromonas sp. P1-8]KPV96912.1 GalNAc(5)-diNAcBac-PP-undecaprenol beta-1,3-glucosyltransferase [Pseudoalteromonas sp. P1-8]
MINHDLSVVITTQNRNDDLVRAIKSIKTQSVLPKEVIVVDDGSDVRVHLSLLSELPNSILTVIHRNSEPMGANYSRNMGLKLATSTLVSFLDDDDEFYPNKIEKVLKEYSNTNADIITSKAKVDFINSKSAYTISPSKHVSFETQLIKNEVGTTSMVTIKREFAVMIGGFSEELPARQDYEAWLKALMNGAKVAVIDDVLTKINVFLYSSSISKSLNNNYKAIEIIDRKYSSYLARLNQKQIKARKNSTYLFLCHKYLISKGAWKGASFAMKSFVKTRSVKFLILSFVLLFGEKGLSAMMNFRGKK